MFRLGNGVEYYSEVPCDGLINFPTRSFSIYVIGYWHELVETEMNIIIIIINIGAVNSE